MNDKQRTAMGEANSASWDAADKLRAVKKGGPLNDAAAAHLQRADLLLVEFRAALDAAVKASETSS